jgi:hypothetical protein
VHTSLTKLIAAAGVLLVAVGLVAGLPAVAGATDATTPAMSSSPADPGLTLTATPAILRAGRQLTLTAHIRWLFAHCPVGTPVWNVP